MSGVNEAEHPSKGIFYNTDIYFFGKKLIWFLTFRTNLYHSLPIEYISRLILLRLSRLLANFRVHRYRNLVISFGALQAKKGKFQAILRDFIVQYANVKICINHFILWNLQPHIIQYIFQISHHLLL